MHDPSENAAAVSKQRSDAALHDSLTWRSSVIRASQFPYFKGFSRSLTSYKNGWITGIEKNVLLKKPAP
jgi:hypothetical protein